MDKSKCKLSRALKMKYYILSSSSRPKGQSGESAGSKYSLDNACKNCGTGAQLIDSLHAKGLKNVKEDFFFTLDGDALITEKLYNLLKSEGLKLKDVSNVVDRKGASLPFYHLNPKPSFPKSLPESEGLKIENQCPVCKQNGYFNDAIIGDLNKEISTYVAPLNLHYKDVEKSFLQQSDIFHSWEHMGLSNLKAEGNKVIRYARPLLIVSEKVKKTFEEFKIKKLTFDEVIISLHSMYLQ